MENFQTNPYLSFSLFGLFKHVFRAILKIPQEKSYQQKIKCCFINRQQQSFQQKYHTVQWKCSIIKKNINTLMADLLHHISFLLTPLIGFPIIDFHDFLFLVFHSFTYHYLTSVEVALCPPQQKILMKLTTILTLSLTSFWDQVQAACIRNLHQKIIIGHLIRFLILNGR